MAILYVVWGVGLLAMIAMSFLSSANVSYAVSSTSLESAQRQALAEAGLARAVLGLLDPRPDKRWRVDAMPQEFVFADTKMRIAIQDELGRIDLNQADQGLLTRLFQSVGLGAPAAGGLAAKILDWRDTGSGTHVNGAKDRDYRTAGQVLGPRNGPFQSVDELQLVMGVSKEIYERALPALTVYSGKPFLDPQFAPREALLALPTMNRGAVEATMAARTTKASRAGIIDPSISLGGRAFSIRTEIIGSAATVHEAVVRLTDQPLQPYWLLHWKVK